MAEYKAIKTPIGNARKQNAINARPPCERFVHVHANIVIRLKGTFIGKAFRLSQHQLRRMCPRGSKADPS
jgi:hypothetical protein